LPKRASEEDVFRYQEAFAWKVMPGRFVRRGRHSQVKDADEQANIKFNSGAMHGWWVFFSVYHSP
jgi:hypothetical protein